jgi:hypothetical protein
MARSKKRSRNWSLIVIVIGSISITWYLYKFITMWQLLGSMHQLFEPIVTVYWLMEVESHYQKYKKLTAEIKQEASEMLRKEQSYN